MVNDLYNRVRNDAWLIFGALCIAFTGGVLPDAVSHGVILPERDGHFELAIIGVFLIAAGLFWLGFSRALLKRFRNVGSGSMEMVE